MDQRVNSSTVQMGTLQTQILLDGLDGKCYLQLLLTMLKLAFGNNILSARGLRCSCSAGGELVPRISLDRFMRHSVREK